MKCATAAVRAVKAFANCACNSPSKFWPAGNLSSLSLESLICSLRRGSAESIGCLIVNVNKRQGPKRGIPCPALKASRDEDHHTFFRGKPQELAEVVSVFRTASISCVLNINPVFILNTTAARVSIPSERAPRVLYLLRTPHRILPAWATTGR